MSLPQHAQLTLDDFKDRIAAHEREITAWKRSANMICAAYGVDPVYSDDDIDASNGNQVSRKPVFKADAFYGKPLATCIREVLEAGKSAGGDGPMDSADIYGALRAGGYVFDSKDDDAAMRGMLISIGKNTATFVRLPNDQISLAEWYAGPRKSKLTQRRKGVVIKQWPIPAYPPRDEVAGDAEDEADQQHVPISSVDDPEETL